MHVCCLTAVPGSPTLMNIPSTSCDPMSGNQVTLQWTPPTDTGGPGVNIERYVVDVTGPAGVTCSPEHCNMISGTTTTITGLLCDANYTVTVRAVNCRNESNSSPPAMITVTTPGEVFKILGVVFMSRGTKNIIVILIVNLRTCVIYKLGGCYYYVTIFAKMNYMY